MFDARRLYKYVTTLYICLFDTFHTLHINVQNANASRSTYISNGFFATTHTHTCLFNGPLSRTTRVSRYQKGKTNLDFTEARDSEWQWHQLGHMQYAPHSRQITTPAPHHSVFLQDGCPSCRPTNSVKAQKAVFCYNTTQKNLCVQLYPLRRQQLLKNEPKIKAENNKDALLNTNVKMASCSRI